MSDRHGYTVGELARLADKCRAEAESCLRPAKLVTKFPDQWDEDCRDPRVWGQQAETCKAMAAKFEERIPVRAAIDQRELDASADGNASAGDDSRTEN